MNESVVALASETVVDGGGGKDFSAAGEGDIDRIDRALSVNTNVTPVRKTGEDAASPAFPRPAAICSGKLVAEVSSTEVKSSIRAKVRSMLVCPAVEFHLPDDFFALVGYPVIIGVLQPPEIRGGDDVEGSIVPEAALRHGHPVSENGALVEDAVAIGVAEAANEPWKFLLDLLAGREVAAVAFRHIKPALVIEAGHHGILEKGRGGCESDFESIPHLDKRGLEGGICDRGGGYCSQDEPHCSQSTRRCEFLPLACAVGGC